MQVFGVCGISWQAREGGELGEARPNGEGLELQPLPIVGGPKKYVFLKKKIEPLHKTDMSKGGCA